MANLQPQFEEFHRNIQLEFNNEQANLRQRRDAVLNRLRDRLRKYAEDNGQAILRFEPFNQGSYAMNTGIKPLDNRDYDIDVGLRFSIDRTEWPDPVALKNLVCQLLQGHTGDVSLNRPCVTVNYVGEYHVDLAIYASRDKNQERDYLSWGYLNSDDKAWMPSDPSGLIGLINDYSSDEAERLQFRRIVRYLKRWKDVRFKARGNAAPVGIGLTLNVREFLTPNIDRLSNKANDLGALYNVVNRMLSEFSLTSWEDGRFIYAISAKVPVEPFDDVYRRRMSSQQMEKFHAELSLLRDACYKASNEVEPHVAATQLREFFGDDFPLPDPSEGMKRSGASAIITGSASA